MKKSILPTFLLLLFSSFLLSQNREITGGGGGNFMTGPTLIFANNITDYLQEPAVLGPNYDPSTLGIQAGGEGFGIVRRFTIGGGGFGYNSFNSTAENGKIERSGGGAYFRLGYRFFTKNTSFVTLNTGFGGFGYTLKIKNTSVENDIVFNRLDPVKPGEERTYTFGGTMFDLGVSFKSIIAKKETELKISGFMAGLDAGCAMGIPAGNWGDGDNIQGPPDPRVLFTPYLRLTIGGGKLKFKQ
jgi:hypothetical protein